MPNKKKKLHVTAAPTDRVVLGYLHPGQVSSYFCQSLMNLLMYDQATSRRIVGCLNEWSSANISASRNSVVENFLGGYDAEWLLFIDADMAFAHDSLDGLMKSADAETRPIVGGLCFGSAHGELFPTIYQMGTDEDGEPTTMRVTDYPDDELVPCAATGAAFVLIHRSVLKAFKRHDGGRGFNRVFPWFQETTLGPNPVGEDITFCLRAGILGYPVHVDTSVRVGHHKSWLLDHDVFRAQQQEGTDDAAPSVAG